MRRHVFFGHGRRAESGALDLPPLVSRFLEVLENNIRSLQFSARRIHRFAHQHREFVCHHHRIRAQNTGIRSDRVDEHLILQPSADFDLNLVGRSVFHPVAHDGGWITRVVIIERDKRRVGIQDHFDRTIRIGITNRAERIGTGKNDIFPTPAVERANLLLSVGNDFQGKTLLERRRLVPDRVDVIPSLPHLDPFRTLVPRPVLVLDHAGHDAVERTIENIPIPEFSVATEIDQRAGGDAADRHADVH